MAAEDLAELLESDLDALDPGGRARDYSLTDGDKSDLTALFRAALADRIEPAADGWHTINGEWKLRLSAGTPPITRPASGKTELLVPVRFSGQQARIVEEFAW